MSFVNNNPTSAQKLPVVLNVCLWLAWMEVIILQWPIFSKFFLCILDKLLKIDYGLFFLGEKLNKYFLPSVVKAISCDKLTRFFKIFTKSSFDQNTAKSP